jgi:hypothetical protein
MAASIVEARATGAGWQHGRRVAAAVSAAQRLPQSARRSGCRAKALNALVVGGVARKRDAEIG